MFFFFFFFFRKRQCPASARRWADVGLECWTNLFCFMFVLDLALLCVLVVSASVDVGAALVQNWVGVLCSK